MKQWNLDKGHKILKKGLIVYVAVLLGIGTLWLGSAQESTPEVEGRFSLNLNEEKTAGELQIRAVPTDESIQILKIVTPDGVIHDGDNGIMQITENGKVIVKVTIEERKETIVEVPEETLEPDPIPEETEVPETEGSDVGQETKTEPKMREEIIFETVVREVKLSYEVTGIEEKLPEISPSPEATEEPESPIMSPLPSQSPNPSPEAPTIENPINAINEEGVPVGAVLSTFNGSEGYVDDNGNLLLHSCNFPDANFLSYLSTLGTLVKQNATLSGVVTPDIQSVSKAQVNAVATIECKNKSIQDLSGIEYFISLETLTCYYNQLSNLNVSKNVELKKLSCYNNSLTSLDLSQNINLTELFCQSNQLTSLNISQNVNLTNLSCNNNKLADLDISQNVKIKNLNCSNNQLAFLNITQNVNLESIECYNNQLTNLNVSQNVKLFSLFCHKNSLTNLDLSQNLVLEVLSCYTNQLSSLDVSKIKNLTYLACQSNQLSNLDLSQNLDLIFLSCDNNKLTSLDLSNNTSLEGNSTTTQSLENSGRMVRAQRNESGQWILDLSSILTEEHWDRLTVEDATQIGSTGTFLFSSNEMPAKITYSYDTRSSKQAIKNMKVQNISVKRKFTVNFESNNGSLIEKQDIYEGDLINKPIVSAKEGYNFEGWYKEPDLINLWNFETDLLQSDMTLYAKWDIKQILISFRDGDQELCQETGAYGSLLNKVTNPVKEGYNFEGWYKEPDLINLWKFETELLQSDMNLYAKWEVIPSEPKEEEVAVIPPVLPQKPQKPQLENNEVNNPAGNETDNNEEVVIPELPVISDDTLQEEATAVAAKKINFIQIGILCFIMFLLILILILERRTAKLKKELQEMKLKKDIQSEI